jgi:hypothetical protein
MESIFYDYKKLTTQITLKININELLRRSSLSSWCKMRYSISLQGGFYEK